MYTPEKAYAEVVEQVKFSDARTVALIDLAQCNMRAGRSALYTRDTLVLITNTTSKQQREFITACVRYAELGGE